MTSHHPPAARPRFRWGRLSGCLLVVALMAGAGVMVAACSGRAAAVVAGPVAAAVIAPAPVDTRDAEAQLAEARDQVARLEHLLGAADQDVARLERARDELAREDVRRRLAWLAGLLLLGLPASVALWFILPVGLKAWAVYGGLGCIGFSAAAYAARAVVPWLELIGWLLLAAGVVWGLWQLWRFKRTTIDAADHAERLEQAVLGLREWFQGDEALLRGLLDDVKHDSAKAQTARGTRRILALIRGKNPRKPTAPAIASLAQPPAAGGGA